MHRIFRLILLTGVLASSAGPVLAQQQSSATLSSATCPGSGCVLLGVAGQGSASIELVGSGTWTAVVEGSILGSTFAPLNMTPSTGTGVVTSATASGLWTVSVAGLTQVRVRLSPYTSGTVVASIQSSPSGGGSSSGGGGGDATAAKQDTQITSLSNIETNTNNINGKMNSDAEHDVAANLKGPQDMGYASAAAPTAVSADGDAVRGWYNLSGARANFLVGTSNAIIPGDATNGLFTNVKAVPADPFGLNADAASATGSISAKLRFIAGTGIPITGTVTVNSHAVTNAGTFAVQAAPAASTTGGSTPIAVVSAASTNSTTAVAAASTLYGAYLVNTTATLYYLRFYDASSAPTCNSATNFKFTLPVPASTSGAGFSMPFPVGIAFTTGISYCLTGGPTSTDNTNAAVGIYGVLSTK